MSVSTDFGFALLVVAPFLAALVAPLLNRFAGRFAAPLLALVPAAMFALLCSFLVPVAHGAPLRARLPWLPAFGIDLSFTLDGLSLCFDLLIAGIGALVVLYSGASLRGHPHLGRFLMFLFGFMGAMQLLVVADDLVLLYAGWELTSVASFLLIGFDHTRQAARRAAAQALILTSAGGLALLAGVVLLHAVAGAWDVSAILASGAAIRASGAYPLVLGLIAAAAFTKSAQLPFHFWLPNAMQAPTPVSAYLHSATMVQAGIYLLARLSPALGGTPAWTATLTAFGGVTLLWGAAAALRQTDLKQMLAYSTVSSLGLLVLLLGLGGPFAATAAIVYFLAHALYKAGLFLVAGLIDHETGVRDIVALGGLRDRMALSFIAAALAGFSMLGLPPALGYLAKEAMYQGLAPLQWEGVVLPLALLLGNAALGALALVLVVRPYLGPLQVTPKDPHEGPVAMLAGPAVLGIAGIAMAVLGGWLGEMLVAPAAAAIAGSPVAPHLGFVLDPRDPALWLSLATWAASGLLFWRLDAVRTVLRRFEAGLGWSFDRAYDALLAGLVRLSLLFVRSWQNGRLRRYLAVLFLAIAAAAIVPLLFLGRPALAVPGALTPPEWGVLVLALAGLLLVVAAANLLFAILALGVQGFAVALLYLLFGAPDLGFTQLMVETLSVVMFALVLAQLRLDRHRRRPLPVALRDAALALLCGGGLAAVLLAILAGPFDSRLGDFFVRNAAAVAHGRNVVNVILVDFRGLDTLGEISVVLAAGVAIVALIATGRGAARGGLPGSRRARRAKAGAAE